MMKYINIHSHKISNEPDVISLTNIFAADAGQLTNIGPGYFSVGLHPWYIRKERLEEDMALAEKAASHPQVIAIGETGLDRITDADWSLQQEVFGRHLEIAARAGKPVIVHAVKSHPEVISLHRSLGLDVQMIFHDFNKHRNLARQLLDHGFYLSLKASLLSHGRRSENLIGEIPDDRLFLETDDTGMDIREFYQAVAEEKNIPVDELKRIIHKNFETCFGGLL
ncbi:MAG: TatD family hydrolase [Bacteroidales bacterium]